MATLTGKDAARVLEIVAEAEASAGDQPFTRELLVWLGNPRPLLDLAKLLRRDGPGT